MTEGITCYERDETLCEDQMCQRTGCRLRNERLSGVGAQAAVVTDEMVQRACETYSEVYADDDKDMGDAMLAVLKEALAAQPPAAPVETVLEECEDLQGRTVQTVRLADGTEVVRTLPRSSAETGEARRIEIRDGVYLPAWDIESIRKIGVTGKHFDVPEGTRVQCHCCAKYASTVYMHFTCWICPECEELVNSQSAETSDVHWPAPEVVNPDIASPTAVPYINCLIHRLLDAQQDINLAANEEMSQSLCDAAALLDEVEQALRAAAQLPTPPQGAPK